MQNEKRNAYEQESVYRVHIVNYTLIREIWKLINGAKNSEEFYKRIEIEPNKYSKLTNNSGSIPRMVEHSKKLAKMIGIGEEYFNGKKIFKIKGIEGGEWGDYIYYKEERKAKVSVEGSQEAKDYVRELEERIRAEIEVLKQEDINVIREYEELYKVYYWMKYKVKFQGTLVEKELEHLTYILEHTEINKLEKLSDEQLKKHIGTLQEQLRRANAVKVYREYISKKIDGQDKDTHINKLQDIDRQVYKFQESIGRGTKI